MGERPTACSSILGPLLVALYPGAEQCCGTHDVAYERGGDERQRLIDDVRFLLDLLLADVAPVAALQAWNAVRIGGGSHFNYTGGATPVAYNVPDVPDQPPQG